MRIFSLILAALHGLVVPMGWAADTRPNILLIFADGVRRSEMGGYNSSNAPTKNIDALAARGARFTDAYAAAPVGFATRAALVTGNHPARLHFTDAPAATRPDPTRRSVPAPVLPANLNRFPSLLSFLMKAGYEVGDFAGLDLKINSQPGSNITASADRAVQFINAAHAKPWFLAVSLAGTDAGELDSAVGAVAMTLESLHLSSRTAVIFTATCGAPYPPKLLETAATSYHPLNGQEGFLYEGGIRVPLIIVWPGRAEPGSVRAEPVSTMDLFPTIAGGAGLELNPALRETIDGQNIFSAVGDGAAISREALFWHFPHYGPFESEPASAIRLGSLKLIQFCDFPRLELFDLAADPGERRNLAEARPADLARLRTRLDLWKQAVAATPVTRNAAFTLTISPGVDGVFDLPGRLAQPHGALIRYEPQPHKNTVGYWANGQDWVSWDIDVKRPGIYEVEIQQGCGTGGPGSDMDLSIGAEKLSFVVEQTGHFQNFVNRRLGPLEIKEPGRHTLELRAATKRGGAVMDVRRIRLLPLTQHIGAAQR